MNPTAFVIASLAAASIALPTLAIAQNRAPKAPAEITVTNARGTANLVSLTLVGQDGAAIAALKKPLAPGKSVKLKLAKRAPCELTVAAAFDDENDGAGGEVNVCEDKTLRLTD